LKNKTFLVHSHNIHLNAEYIKWIKNIKDSFRNSQIKAAVKVNSEQLFFNWNLGRDLNIKRIEQKWGTGIVEQISLDLQSEFPTVKGFSVRNLWNMKKWYSFYAFSKETKSILKKIENKINTKSVKLQQVGAEIKRRNIKNMKKLHQLGAEMDFPKIFCYVPWRHHIEIITKCKSVNEALFYISKVVEENLSRKALIDCINADMFHKSKFALTNFSEKLPVIQGKLAQEIIKDNYDFSFVSLYKGYNETELEEALEQNITKFLLELGKGFAFIGRQKEIIVSGKIRKIDMLFYHIHLKCYIVVELKTTSFEPEFAGKLNFYVNAVNELIKTDNENPTIGLLICKDKNQTEVQWAFQGIQNPMGIASYDKIKLKEIQKQLPTAKQIQKHIALIQKEINLNIKKS